MSGTTDKKFLVLDGLEKLVDNIKASFSSVNHVHDNYTLKSDFQSLESSLADGNVTVAKAAHATSADSATTAITSEASTKTVQDASGNVITETYETKTDASSKLAEAKSYADTQIAALVNSAPETLDTLGELATAMQENDSVVEALDAAITTKADKSDVAIADWSVNDPSSPAYIANRTHWIGDSVETFLVEEMTVEIAEANGYAQIPYYEQWVIGETYTVTFNGTRYDCVAYQGDAAVLIGNGEVFGGGSGGNGEPFSCDSYDGETAYVNVAEAGTHTISISHLVNEIHKIDPIFLPEQEQSIGKAGEGLGAEIFNYYGDDGGVSTFALAPDDSPTSNVATGEYSHAEGYLTSATGDYSHTEGGNTKASGFCSHAEGIFTTATEEAAHAEGSNTTAYGQHSHAEGSSTEASGLSSHAEGTMTIAAGESSHAEGYYTEANGDYQHVQGKHNVADGFSVYVHIVGNGANQDEPSNAHTLDWSGNAWYQGGIYVGGTVVTNEDGTVDYSGASEVMLKSDIVAITNEEIDAIFASI